MLSTSETQLVNQVISKHVMSLTSTDSYQLTLEYSWVVEASTFYIGASRKKLFIVDLKLWLMLRFFWPWGFALSIQMNIDKYFQRLKGLVLRRYIHSRDQIYWQNRTPGNIGKHTWESSIVGPMWLTIQLICFVYLQASTSAAIEKGAARQVQEGTAVANEEMRA